MAGSNSPAVILKQIQSRQRNSVPERLSRKEEDVDLNLALSDAHDGELACTIVKRYPEDDNEILFVSEQVIKVENELSCFEVSRPVWNLEQTIGWIEYRTQDFCRSIGQVDLQPPKYYGKSYASHIASSKPLVQLSRKLLEGKLKAYDDGEEMSVGQWVEILKTSIWSAPELAFRAIDVFNEFPPESAEIVAKKLTRRSIQDATRAITAILRSSPNMSKSKARENLVSRGHKFSGSNFKYEIWPDAWEVLKNEGIQKPGAGRKPKSATRNQAGN